MAVNRDRITLSSSGFIPNTFLALSYFAILLEILPPDYLPFPQPKAGNPAFTLIEGNSSYL